MLHRIPILLNMFTILIIGTVILLNENCIFIINMFKINAN
ncbi:hypothetical protein HMPREF1573_00256 [Gardnerella vaginalis JCP7276]|nr:hypothetical protein HMPREF1575_00100 [Gardnerella vaginalis JCP7672]EPI56798.1 hypothetical protein HMPREF1572_00672 [Gardnerella vaginalis JCP7275]EPI57438.1 hypothetical protein HMPREF1573_00256 [Gardnerella vaginalis JCP7276]